MGPGTGQPHAVHVDGPKAADADVRIDFAFSDKGETWTMWVRHGVLNARRGASADAQATVSGPKGALVAAVLQPAAVSRLVDAGKVTLNGDAGAFDAYAAVLDEIIRAKPSVAKGRYLRSITLASTQGPGIKVDPTRTRDIVEEAPAAVA